MKGDIMRVDIYRNLNRAKQGLPEQWSIRHKGLVVGYTSAALLQDAITHVTPGAVEKIRQSGRKQVCAWVTGEWTPTAVLRTERQRGKDLPIYTGEPVPEGFRLGTVQRLRFNPRHTDSYLAQHFFVTDGSSSEHPLESTGKGYPLHCVYFCNAHKAWVVN